MTVSTTHTINSFTGDGAEDTFTYTFQVIESAQIHAYEDSIEDLNITIVVNADQVANPGGTVTFDSGAPANLAIVEIKRITSINQLAEYSLGGNFPSESHEQALDKLTMIDQEADGTANAADIATNAADIATNTADIATNAADIATNTADIATNSKFILETDIDLAGLSQIDFLNVPSWTKRISIMVAFAASSATTIVEVGIGDSGSIYTTGYIGQQGIIDSLGYSVIPFTAAFKIAGGSGAGSTQGVYALATLINLTGNTWLFSSNGQSILITLTGNIASGSITLTGILDKLRIYSSGGSAFTGGKVNVSYEG